mmetsp:Transcript_5659/g.15954  ORF Transcript_5659/g.15954 Transcript_5659/m.15954 type:complete len:203 (-) Transcript_5659:700-1308(-)
MQRRGRLRTSKGQCHGGRLSVHVIHQLFAFMQPRGVAHIAHKCIRRVNERASGTLPNRWVDQLVFETRFHGGAHIGWCGGACRATSRRATISARDVLLAPLAASVFLELRRQDDGPTVAHHGAKTHRAECAAVARCQLGFKSVVGTTVQNADHASAIGSWANEAHLPPAAVRFDNILLRTAAIQPLADDIRVGNTCTNKGIG